MLSGPSVAAPSNVFRLQILLAICSNTNKNGYGVGDLAIYIPRLQLVLWLRRQTLWRGDSDSDKEKEMRKRKTSQFSQA